MRCTATHLRRFVLGLSAIALFVAMAAPTRAQVTTLSGYTYSYSTGNRLTDMSSATTLVSSGVDDAAYGTWEIGFDFVFCGTTYNYFSVSTNGPLGLHTSSDGMVSSNIGAELYDPPFAPFIAGGTADLYTNGNGIRSQVFGTAPNRYLVVEYDIHRYGNSGTTAIWQIRLYEGTNAFEIVYGASSSSGWENLHVGATNGYENFVSITTSDNTVSYSSDNSSNSPAAEGTAYRFAPCTPAITLLGDETQGGTGKMIDNDSLLFGMEIERGSSGVFYPFTVELGTNPCALRSYTLSIVGSAAGDYSISPATGTLDGGQSVTPAVTFTPQMTGLRQALLIVSDDGGFYRSYRLMATGLPRISWTGNVTDGGTLAMADKDTLMSSVGAERGTVTTFHPFTLENFSRNIEAPLADVTFILTDPTGQYSIDPASAQLGAGESVSPTITFNATGLGPQYATLVVTADGDTRTYALKASSRAPQIRFTAGSNEITPDLMVMYSALTCAGEQVVSEPIQLYNFGQLPATISGAMVATVNASGGGAIQSMPLARDARGRVVSDPQFQLSLVPGTAPLNRANDLTFPLTIPAGGSRTIYLNFVGSVAGRPIAKAFLWTNAQNFANGDTAGLEGMGTMSFMVGPRVLGAKLAADASGRPIRSVVFPAVKLGGSDRKSVMIANAGDCDLRISRDDLRIHSGDVREFELASVLPNTRIDAATGDFVLPPQASDSIVFVFKPDSRGGRRITVRLVTNDSAIYLNGLSERGTQYFDVFGEGATDLATRDITLGQVLVNDVITASTTVENPNIFPLTITAIEFTGADAAEFTADASAPWPATPYEIKPAERLALSLRWAPVGAPGRRDAKLVLRSGTTVIGTIRVSAEAGNRELTVTPSSLFDGISVPVGQVVRRTVAITNTGSFDVRLQTPQLSGPDAANYRVARLARMLVAPGTTEYLEVTFSPSGTGQSSATLEIASNAGNSPATVSLGGESMEILPDNGQPGREVGSEDDGSGVLSVQRSEAPMDVAISVWPNPARHATRAQITIREATDLHATLMGSDGRVLRELGVVRCLPGLNTFLIDVSEFSAGELYLRVYSRQGMGSLTRFLVLR